MFRWNLRVPFLYQNSYITLKDLEVWLLRHHHPIYVRRLLAWLHYKNGTTGVGGGWRPHGGQPVRPGFAPEGRSFHQYQWFYIWGAPPGGQLLYVATAVDTVFMDGPDRGDWHDPIAWREVPAQGSSEAKKWGIHANVGVPGNGESWHIQPIEIDGWVRATGNGSHPCPALDPYYPIPIEHDPYYSTPPQQGDGMIYLDKMDRMHDSRPGYQQMDSEAPQTTLKPGKSRKIALGMAHVHGVRVTVVNSRGPGFVTITGSQLGASDPGIPVVNMWDGKSGDGTLTLATPTGHGYLKSTVECDVIVDVSARGT